jgi:hypothetical protein
MTDPKANPRKHERVHDDPSLWTFINQWQVEPQSNDRLPMSGAVVPTEGVGPAVRRSVARRLHQLQYKEWSKQRHD